MTNRIIHFLLHGPKYEPKKALIQAMYRPLIYVFLMGLCYSASYGFQLYWANPMDFHPSDIVTFTRVFEGYHLT